MPDTPAWVLNHEHERAHTPEAIRRRWDGRPHSYAKPDIDALLKTIDDLRAHLTRSSNALTVATAELKEIKERGAQ